MFSMIFHQQTITLKHFEGAFFSPNSREAVKMNNISLHFISRVWNRGMNEFQLEFSFLYSLLQCHFAITQSNPNEKFISSKCINFFSGTLEFFLFSIHPVDWNFSVNCAHSHSEFRIVNLICSLRFITSADWWPTIDKWQPVIIEFSFSVSPPARRDDVWASDIPWNSLYHVASLALRRWVRNLISINIH